MLSDKGVSAEIFPKKQIGDEVRLTYIAMNGIMPEPGTALTFENGQAFYITKVKQFTRGARKDYAFHLTAVKSHVLNLINCQTLPAVWNIEG